MLIKYIGIIYYNIDNYDGIKFDWFYKILKLVLIIKIYGSFYLI